MVLGKDHGEGKAKVKSFWSLEGRRREEVRISSILSNLVPSRYKLRADGKSCCAFLAETFCERQKQTRGRGGKGRALGVILFFLREERWDVFRVCVEGLHAHTYCYSIGDSPRTPSILPSPSPSSIASPRAH